jgi:3-oxoacyl-[acyl-carrier-protein] synthase-1
MNRVVITGLGIYSCIGKSLEEVKNSLREGKSGSFLILFVNKWVFAVH